MARTHGLDGTPTHNSWRAMWRRLRDPDKVAFYAGRGITIADRWRKFENFLVDMGERPPGMTLERVDNDGNYGPDNCIWATRKAQAGNTRNVQKAKRLRCFGGPKDTNTIREWSNISGTPISTIESRLRKGWPDKQAVFGRLD